MPNYCIICGSSKSQDAFISLYCFPKQLELRKKWLDGLHLTPDNVECDSRVYSKHFRDGNPKTVPSYQIGAKFAEPPSMETARRKRRVSRELQQKEQKRQCIRKGQLPLLTSPLSPPTLASTPLATLHVPPTSHSSTPTPICTSSTCTPRSSATPDPLVVSPAKSRHVDCSESNVSLVLSECGSSSFVSTPGSSVMQSSTADVQVTVNAALTSQIEQLQAENKPLKNQLDQARPPPFRVECVSYDDALVSIYTGFPSFDVFVSFSDFLGQLMSTCKCGV